MKNIDNPNIDRYLRDEMSPDERLKFEAKIAIDSELQQDVEETRLLAEGIRFTAQRDTRRRAEVARDNYQQTVWLQKMRPQLGIAASIVMLVGLLLGYSIFSSKEKLPPVPPPPESDQPIAIPEHEVIFRGKIPEPRSGKTTSFSVALNPDIQKPEYAFYGPDGGICFYTSAEDDFWKKQSLELTQENGQFFLKIGGQTTPLIADGENHILIFK